MNRFAMARLIFAFLFVALSLSRPAAAQERITNFSSDITIAANGALTVRETISVEAENAAIVHGIFRDFPTDYRDSFGNRIRVRFDVSEVELDGRTAHYAVETIANGKRVRIGDADVTVRRGPHIYLIVYRTDRQIGFFDGYDELYWNVTGNAWAFRIDRAEAVIHLPQDAAVVQTASYTGPQGAQGTNARANVEGGTVRFTTTAPLGEYEGLTVAAGFTKGIVAPPGDIDKAQDFLRDNAGTGAALLGLMAITIFYFRAWWRFGRDPARGVIVPLFAPPKNFSAAAVRFVHLMAYDRKAFAAALIAMAVKGYLKISESGGTYTLTRTDKGVADLQSTEVAIGRVLFAANDQIALKNTNHVTVSRAVSALRMALKREDEGVYFVSNGGWWFGGFLILVVSGVATAWLSEDPDTGGLLVWLGGLSWAVLYLLFKLFNAWHAVLFGPGSRFFNFISAFFVTVFIALPITIGLITAIVAFGFSLPMVTVGAVVLQGVFVAVFYHLLKAPTLLGARIRDQIDGFRMFLVTAEKDRLEKLNPPQVTPEVFEKFLPYAIALDAENEWSRKFEADAAKAAQGPNDTAYTPNWYSGHAFGRFNTTRFATSIGTAVAAATASAATAPGHSSGSGGGGSSGGGGGGGGGGGW
jgi:uncharacterized membrane protein YgcG